MSLPNDIIDWDEIFDSLTTFNSPWKAVAAGILLQAIIDWWKTCGTERAKVMLEFHCGLSRRKSNKPEGLKPIFDFAEEFDFDGPQEELSIFLSSERCHDLFDFVNRANYHAALKAIGFDLSREVCYSIRDLGEYPYHPKKRS